jgi:cell shape-determining protein MreD
MKLLAGSFAFLMAVFFLLILQEFFPPVLSLHGARIVLVPMVFCYFALAAPAWTMLLAAVYTGFLTDLMYLHFVDGQVEIGLGWSIVFFVLFGLFAHGFQPAFLRGRWWLHVGLTALGTCSFLALQYAMISFRREGLILNELVAWRILAPGLVAAVLAPFVHLLVVQCRHFFPEITQEPGRYRSPR